MPNQFWSILKLALEMGYLIALPLVVLALTGRWLDKYFNLSPLFLLTGILFSIIISSFSIYRKIKKIV